MKRLIILGVLACGGLLPLADQRRVAADEAPAQYREMIQKGLTWLVRQQHKDGHWAANNNQFPVAITGMAGMTLLMDGSTLREGKYADNTRRATDWLMEQSQTSGMRNGLIGNPDKAEQANVYMYGHGFAMLFLASVYGDEETKDRREKLKDILTRAVIYTGRAQSTRGGWYYKSRTESNDADEGSVTVTQLQALRACRNAGIAVPKVIIDKARDYLQKSTTVNGGVIYQLSRGGGLPSDPREKYTLTAAAIACSFSAGEYNSEYCKKWFAYCKNAIPVSQSYRIQEHEYTHYYYAQCIYILGEDGWGKLFPSAPKNQWLTWSKYRQELFGYLQRLQNADGSWSPQSGDFSQAEGPVYCTATYLTILQLDRGVLPIYQR
jgi:hypothetical protein